MQKLRITFAQLFHRQSLLDLDHKSASAGTVQSYYSLSTSPAMNVPAAGPSHFAGVRLAVPERDALDSGKSFLSSVKIRMSVHASACLCVFRHFFCSEGEAETWQTRFPLLVQTSHGETISNSGTSDLMLNDSIMTKRDEEIRSMTLGQSDAVRTLIEIAERLRTTPVDCLRLESHPHAYDVCSAYVHNSLALAATYYCTRSLCK